MPDDLEELDDVMEWMEEKADYVTEVSDSTMR